jgi:hypothetical protein
LSPLPKVKLRVLDETGQGIPGLIPEVSVSAAPPFHEVETSVNGKKTIQNATLFRFETVEIPLQKYQANVDMRSVRKLVLEIDSTVRTHFLIADIRLLKL